MGPSFTPEGDLATGTSQSSSARPKECKGRRSSMCAKHKWGRAGQWNLAGQSVSLLDVVAKDLELVFVQEVARGQHGWGDFDTEEFHWVVHRDSEHWRGVGVGIASDKFDSIVYKQATKRGIWVVARVHGLGRVLLGSLHAHTGVTNAVYQGAVLEFLQKCPRKYRHLPLLCGVDANEVPNWIDGDGEGLEIGSCSANLNVLVQEALRLGAEPLAPEPTFRNAWTHFPRDVERSGRQIDMILRRHFKTTPILICADRRLAIGSDHALLVTDIWIASRPSRVRWKQDSRARWVVKELEQVPIVDANELTYLAKTCTKPRYTQAYRDDEEVHTALATARDSNLPADWKRVFRVRKAKRKQWQQARLSRILAGDWEEYRCLQKDKRRRKGWWGDLLKDRSSAQLTAEIQQHLEAKMTDGRPGFTWDERLEELIESCVRPCHFVPFQMHEVVAELNLMKCRSAVGPDGIGVHLLKTIAVHAELGGDLLAYINHIVETQQIPDNWGESFLALLAKVPLPQEAKDLRPICVSSAFNKLVNRLACSRVLPALRVGSKISCCGKGRQSADLVGCVSRVRDVCKEWKLPLLVCKLDVSGAFDRIDREAVARHLIAKLQGIPDLTCELRYMLKQLATHALVGCVPGGHEIRLFPDVGIKQGAPESAEIFGMIVDSMLSEVVACRRWGDFGLPFDELDQVLLFFQDDIFILETDLPRLCRRVKVVDRCLARVGLKLATEKTKIVANEHYVGPKRVKIRDDMFVIAERGESVRVLGVNFSLGKDASEQAKEIISRTRQAAAEHKDILEAAGSWRSKTNIMRTLLESQFNWVGGALHWSQEDLHSLNLVQLHTCRSSFGLKRYAGETWVDWNKRSLRMVRLWLHTNHVSRWSERILTLQHMLHGHWARRTEVAGGIPQPCPPMKALQWRCTHWWRGQQSMSPAVSLRHPGRFYASNTERQLAEALGPLWFVRAQDRQNWCNDRKSYVAHWDVKWASGRQLSLTM